MRSVSFLSVALALGPAAVVAAGTLGFSLGCRKPDGSCKQTSDYEADFDALQSVSKLVRIYAASQCDTAKNIIPAAKAKGFKVVLGVWPDTQESFDADTAALKATVPGNEDIVEACTVGSETLYRGNFTGEQLLSKIQTVQGMLPGVTVGTADSWNKYADGTADPLITGGVTYFLANAFAYWQGTEINNSTGTYFDDIAQAIERIQKIAGPDKAKKITIINGETGWPTDGGSNYGAAAAGTNNAAEFYKKGVCGMLEWGVSVFYFEAFDEPWKPNSVGDSGQAMDEKHWGLYTADRQIKFDTSCSYS